MTRSRSLSLAAYRVLSWRGSKPGDSDAPPRPKGEVLWIHVAARKHVAPVNDFCRRLQQLRPDLSVMFTIPNGSGDTDWGGMIAPVFRLPEDNTNAVRRFLDHWCPDMGVWVGGGLLPNLISDAADRGIPLILLEGEIDVVVPRRHRWLPDIPRHTLNCFRAILTTSEDKARQIRRLGVPFSKVSVSALLRVSPNPLPWPEDELIEANHALTSRPVWLAAWVQDKEFITVLTAHRHALRMLPRLVLILHVADATEAGPLRKRLHNVDLRCADWDAGDAIEDNTQVILCSDPQGLGLWYRVSPLTFLGSSLEFGALGQNPLDAVALGSGIIHGPYVRYYTGVYARLANAKASRIVRSAEELGEAVADLLAPDQVADMALAGWQVVSEGAELIDQLTDMVQETLDRRGANHAGA